MTMIVSLPQVHAGSPMKQISAVYSSYTSALKIYRILLREGGVYVQYPASLFFDGLVMCRVVGCCLPQSKH
jgi:hypothetical protein